MILLPEVRQNLIRRTSVQKVLGYYYTEIKMNSFIHPTG